MSYRLSIALLIIGYCLSSHPPPLFAQGNILQLAEGQSSPNAQIDDFSWIAGSWRGEALGGEVEEIWSQPMGPSMMGSFKMMKGDNVVFYELCVLREIDDSVLLQIKHFGDDLTGWEEKEESVRFPLVKMEHHKAYFAGITFHLVQPDELHISVLIDDEEIAFVYHREKS